MKIGKITNKKYDAVFVSPHLDDAVLSCGGLIISLVSQKKKVLVVTVFTEGVGKKRKLEDMAVCKILKIDYQHLGYIDRIVRGDEVPRTKIQKMLEKLNTDEIYFPMGVGGHEDHQIVRQIGQNIRHQHIYFWEDYPYKLFTSTQIEILKIRTEFVLGRVINVEENLVKKKDLIKKYKSQMALIFGSKPMYLSTFEKYYVYKSYGVIDGLIYLTDELDGGAKIANDYILEEISRQTNLNKFEFLEQVYRKDNSRLSGTKKWLWSVWSYFVLLRTLDKTNLTILTTSPNAIMAMYLLIKLGLLRNIKIFFYSNGDRSYFSKNLLKNRSLLSYIYTWLYCRIYRLMEQIACQTIDKVIVASKYYKNEMLCKYGWNNSGKIEVIAHGVDTEVFYPGSQRTGKNKFIVGYVGRVDPLKGILELIKAIQILDKTKYELWIIASNIQNDKYYALVRQYMKISANIKLINPDTRNQLADIYRGLDLVVLPSEIENSPLVMFEAMASGCGFVGSKTGSMLEMIPKIDKELLLDNVSVDEIVDKIHKYFDVPYEKREQLSKKSVSLMNKYGWSNTASQILRIINMN